MITGIKIFVYGTLKRGYFYHQHYCTASTSIEDAYTWGRLFHLPEGYPGLEIPNDRILSIGTLDPLADLYKQREITPATDEITPPEGDWDKVYGEVITFSDPAAVLPLLDELEDFYPGCLSMYHRVLMPVQLQEKVAVVWLYHYVLPHHGQRIRSGQWHPRP